MLVARFSLCTTTRSRLAQGHTHRRSHVGVAEGEGGVEEWNKEISAPRTATEKTEKELEERERERERNRKRRKGKQPRARLPSILRASHSQMKKRMTAERRHCTNQTSEGSTRRTKVGSPPPPTPPPPPPVSPSRRARSARCARQACRGGARVGAARARGGGGRLKQKHVRAKVREQDRVRRKERKEKRAIDIQTLNERRQWLSRHRAERTLERADAPRAAAIG